MTPVCLTVAGSDSGGEAGIQADLKTFKDLGIFGISAVSAVTAQNPAKIISVNPVSAKAFSDQLTALEYFNPQFIKSGLLYTPEQIEILSNFIGKERTLVADPLIISTSGKQLMPEKSFGLFRQKLLPKTAFITPNWPEIEILSRRTVNSKSTAADAMKTVFDLYGASVYLKGGHSDDPGTDYIFNGEDLVKLSAPVLEVSSSHGTGCRLSSALCGSLANSKSFSEAAAFSKNYVYHCLKNCTTLKNGLYVMNSPGRLDKNEIEVEFI